MEIIFNFLVTCVTVTIFNILGVRPKVVEYPEEYTDFTKHINLKPLPLRIMLWVYVAMVLIGWVSIIAGIGGAVYLKFQ